MKRTTITAADVDRRLKDESRILRIRPQYSPLLHQRILSALQEGGLPVDASQPRRRVTVWRIGVPVGIAAAIAVATWIALQPPPVAQPAPGFAGSKPTPQPKVAVSQPVPDTTDVATAALDKGKFAYLDRDASRLFTFVADQIPSLPQPQPK